MKVDIHTNLEWFPTSKSSSTRIYASVQQMADFLNVNEVDVNFCLYPRDQYHMLEQLAEITPHIQHIGVQVMMGACAEDATDPDKVTLDVNDPEKSAILGNGLCHGIKIASHRGWWKKGDEVNSGFCYGNGSGGQLYNSRTLTKWLRAMPKGSICSMHMQGDPINNSASIPTTVGMYAYKNPDIKFIINHCGDFGQGGLSNKPKKYKTIQKKDGAVNYFPAYRYAHSQGLIFTAVSMANTMHNVMLDTSVYTPFKGKMMGKCRNWAIGSDYPFQIKADNDKLKSTSKMMINEEKKFIKDLGEERVKQCHEDAYHWLTADIDTLIAESEWYEEPDAPAVVTEKSTFTAPAPKPVEAPKPVATPKPVVKKPKVEKKPASSPAAPTFIDIDL